MSCYMPVVLPLRLLYHTQYSLKVQESSTMAGLKQVVTLVLKVSI